MTSTAQTPDLRDAEANVVNGHIDRALDIAGAVEAGCADDRATLQRLISLYTQLGRHRRAYDCARRCLDAAGSNLESRYAMASAAIAVGEFDEAEELLDAIIDEFPEQAEACYTRATLRRQTNGSNHVDDIRHKITAVPRGDPAEVPLCYALGKELEDLGRYEEAFDYISRGADARRAGLSYDVRGDVDTMQAIAETFDRTWWDETDSGKTGNGPIFVLGLPRSGTTLVDRILASHSDVASLGEVNDFAYAVMRHGAPASDKRTLMENVAGSAMSALGTEYWHALRGYGEPERRLIDKTPGNYLYLGLIAKALPSAAIVHVRRHPMASGYAMYKSLFRMGYPFSYDLGSLAQYWLAYDRLMDHWHEILADRILDVSYEELVDEQERVSREIVAHCGLEWSEDCLRFHENAAPTATASAVQVRTPIYRSARDLWRQYRNRLAPMERALVAAGVDV